MNNQLISISVDWLQLHCRGKSQIYMWNLDVYEVKKRQYGTSIFEDVEYIFRKGRLIATACSKPRSNVIPEATVIIKFENDILYDKNLDWTVKEFLHYNSIEFVGVSRLDIALDFNFFSNRQDPELLIHKFHCKKIVKMGKGNWKAQGKVGRIKTDEYLRFGGIDSPISVYLYNKTKEMLARKSKPWILQQWDAAGLDTTKDVWRLELSVMGTRKELKNLNTGTTTDFHSIEIASQENIELLYGALIETYFSFAYERRNEKNKSRLPKVNLFDIGNLKLSGVIIERTNKKESTHMDKYFINRLNKMNQELKGTADDIADMATDVGNYFIHSRDMERQQKLAIDRLKSGNPEYKEPEIIIPNPDPEIKPEGKKEDEQSEFDFNN